MSGYSKYLRGRGVGIKYLRKEGKGGVLVSGVWWGKQRVEVGSRREGRGKEGRGEKGKETKSEKLTRMPKEGPSIPVLGFVDLLTWRCSFGVS